MNQRFVGAAVALSILLAPAGAFAAVAPETPLGDPVLYWNAVALQANADDHSGTFGPPEQMGPMRSSRALAIVHGAIYDAVNAMDRGHKPYYMHTALPGSMHFSSDAAVAAAAYVTLSALHPSQQSAFDAALQAHMSQIPDGAAKTFGALIGQASGLMLLHERAHDGAENVVEYAQGDQPGQHRVDPVNPGQPLMISPEAGQVKPFTMTSGAQFRVPPPPALDSQEYVDNFNEVKAFGGDGIGTPTVRNPEQTEIGLYWAYDGAKNLGTPPRLYNQIARKVAQDQGNTVAENARLFALINFAMADSGIGAWESKLFYDFWRPVVAIREADAGTGPTGLGDGNPETVGDPDWTPLGAPNSNRIGSNFTPAFPAYPSGHSTFGAAFFKTMEHFYGTDNIPFTFVSEELNGVTTDNQGTVRPLAPRSFTTFSQASAENALSRIYLGVHWRFDTEDGIAMGNEIADHMYPRFLQPVGN